MKRFNTKIKRIHRTSEKAIAKFLTTEKVLQKQNDHIDAVVTDLTDELFRIDQIRQAAIARRTENAGIATRIGRIVSGDNG